MIIDKFNPNKGASHDHIDYLILKNVANEIVGPRTRIFKLYYWDCSRKAKNSKGDTDLQKDDAEKFSKYRPVSLFPCFLRHLKDWCLIDVSNINDQQFSFQPNHSTFMAIMQLVDKVTNVAEKMKQQWEYF